MSRTTNLAALAVLFSLNAGADVVHFKNGDRLTGDRVEAEAGFVAINVPDLGVWKIPDELIAHVVTTADAGAPAETPDPAATSPIGGLINAWDVTADLATTTAVGNTETSDLNFVAGATRTGESVDHVLGAAWHRGEAEDVLAKDQLDLNYDMRWKYSESWYAVGSFEYFRDPIKDIDQRYTGGAGVGHTFWTSARGALSTDFGVSRVFEKLASVTAPTSGSNPALRWSLSYQRWLAPGRLELFHNNQLLHILASDRGTVWDSDTGLRLHVNSRWQAGLRVDLQHETVPAAGRGRTDAAYAVSFGVKL